MKKYLTPDETNILFKVVDSDSSIHRYRNRAIFYIAKYCAFRVGELSMLKCSDYDIENSCIHCRRSNKSVDNNIIIYDEKVKRAINEYYKIRRAMKIESEFLFISQKKAPISNQMLDYIMKDYCQQTNIPEEKWHFHVLKHTRAMELLSLGFSINEVQWWLGHKSIISTLEYLSDDSIVNEEEIYEKIKKGVELNE